MQAAAKVAVCGSPERGNESLRESPHLGIVERNSLVLHPPSNKPHGCAAGRGFRGGRRRHPSQNHEIEKKKTVHRIF